MDANGLRAFGLALQAPDQPGGLYPWSVAAGQDRLPGIEPAPGHVLVGARLASRAMALPLDEIDVDRSQPPDAVVLRDAFGHALVWSRAALALRSLPAAPARGTRPAPIDVALPDAVKPVFDLAMTTGDVVLVAGGGLAMLDTRSRFATSPVALPAGFSARALAADPKGGAYVLDTATGKVLHVDGQPVSTTAVRTTRSRKHFTAVELNPDPVRVRAIEGATLDAGERAIDFACNARGTLALLTTDSDGAYLRVLADAGRWSVRIAIARPAKPYTLGWIDEEHPAVLARATIPGDDGTARDAGAFVFVLDATAQDALRREGTAGPVTLVPTGEYYPLRDALAGAPLARSSAALIADASGAARLFYARASSIADLGAEPAPVARLSGITRAAYGVLANSPQDVGESTAPVSSARPGMIQTTDLATTWHRLYVEACVPRNTAMVVWLSASDGGPAPFAPADPAHRGQWYPHLVGARAALPPDVAAALPDTTPRAAWLREASEVPQGATLLGCEREENRTGLFSALIQRAGLTVRGLVGRRLWVAVEMFGDGRASPELVALRVYASRASYRDRHLPALYHEQVFGPEGDMPGTATGADFLERFIGLFEGVFTGIEDRIAAAYRLTDAFSAPQDALPWLGSWIGMALEPGVPPLRARRMIANAGNLARRHGTLDGLRSVLDIATDGGVTRGRLVVVEDYRLRRTMATILGARLEDRDDPLTAGIAQSGNSIVGDTLFLGDEDVKTFLALFRDLQADPQGTQAVQKRQRDEREMAVHALYDGLAYRATVLMHEDMDDDEQRLVRRLAQAYAPAHVRVRVVPARYPFLVAVASLVGADTFLREHQDPDAVRIDGSRLGYLDTLQGLGTLDARGGAFDHGGGNGIH